MIIRYRSVFAGADQAHHRYGGCSKPVSCGPEAALLLLGVPVGALVDIRHPSHVQIGLNACAYKVEI